MEFDPLNSFATILDHHSEEFKIEENELHTPHFFKFIGESYDDLEKDCNQR